MKIYNIIQKKKCGLELSNDEIKFFVEGFINQLIPDYQMASLLMAICIKGMTKKEIYDLTVAMINTGNIVDISRIKGVKVDKHSTGGVGDKTTLIILPIVASLGIIAPKISGRSLGYTGGTIDKLESIPNFQTSMKIDKFINILSNVGTCVISQTDKLVPADKKIYALRDVTGTVNSIPLIASSIMSKKIAGGADKIILDVKIGSGAFIKTLDESIELGKIMIDIGKFFDKETVVLITEMDVPLGYAVGNSLEVIEAINILKGNGPKDLLYISIALAKEILYISGKGNIEECEKMVLDTILSGKAFNKFLQMVEAQNGNVEFIKDVKNFKKSKICYEVKSKKSGYIFKINTEIIGMVSCSLGAGRENKKSIIDHSAGIIFQVKTGDYINKGDIIAFLHTSDINKAKLAEEKLLLSIKISDEKPIKNPYVYAKIDKNGVVKY